MVGEAVLIGRREQKGKVTKATTSSKGASLTQLDDEIERLARELDEGSSSHTEDEDEEEEVDGEKTKDEIDSHGQVWILSTPYNESDRIQPLQSSSLPSNTCRTKTRGSASTRVEQRREIIQW
tara:strand:+ start:172 stop:540 length:369 start_codon:yes stop_codon:yes gene_type:complete